MLKRNINAATTKMVSSARTALGFLNKAETANAAFVRSSAEASGIQGTCLYYLAQQISHQDAESPEALKLAKDAEATLKLALAVWERKGAEDIKEGVGYLHIVSIVTRPRLRKIGGTQYAYTLCSWGKWTSFSVRWSRTSRKRYRISMIR